MVMVVMRRLGSKVWSHGHASIVDEAASGRGVAVEAGRAVDFGRLCFFGFGQRLL